MRTRYLTQGSVLRVAHAGEHTTTQRQRVLFHCQTVAVVVRWRECRVFAVGPLWMLPEGAEESAAAPPPLGGNDAAFSALFGAQLYRQLQWRSRGNGFLLQSAEAVLVFCLVGHTVVDVAFVQTPVGGMGSYGFVAGAADPTVFPTAPSDSSFLRYLL